ncbi:MAG: Ig-like domain-containing protein [Pirellulaceae bacterium]
MTVSVAAVNDPPTANDQSISTNEDTAVAVSLSGSDVENDPLTFTVIDSPTSGTLSVPLRI